MSDFPNAAPPRSDPVDISRSAQSAQGRPDCGRPSVTKVITGIGINGELKLGYPVRSNGMSEIPRFMAPFGGEVDRIIVSVRAVGDDLDPDELTRLLGMPPTFAARRGERRLVSGREVRQRTGVWAIEFGGAAEEWTLEDAIVQLLAKLPSDAAIWATLATKYSMDLFCGVFLNSSSRGFALRPEVLRQLSDRHLELDIDIYATVDRNSSQL